ADGMLSPEEAAKVEQAIAEDEYLAEKVAAFADSRTLAKRALGTAPPVSDKLTATIRAMAEAEAEAARPRASAQVVDLASRRRTVPFWQLPIAASVALAIGLSGGWFAKPQSSKAGVNTGGIAVAVIDDAALTKALAEVKSGTRTQIGTDAGFTAIASFRDGDGQLCREFEHDRAGGDAVVAVACRGDDTWSVRFAVASVATGDAGYVPASSLETLDTWLSAIEASAPMSDDQEAAALADLQ
ncbi:MAG: hypothetical protein ACRCS3_12385, partial [Paracoccaceae bacterium]